MRAATFTCGLVLTVMPLAGCQRQPPPPAPDAVARLGGEDVRYADFEGYLKRSVGDTDGVLASDVLSQLFDQFMEEKLLVRLALDRKLVREARGAVGQRAATEALLADGLQQEAGEPEIARYYQDHRQDFARPERVRLRQILTEDRATAERALKEIAGGADFQEVARRLSRDPSAGAGGYQGELTREDLPPSFAEVIFGLKPGEVSRLVPAEYGFHIFQVTDREPAQVIPLAAARPEILGKLRQERADRLLQSLVQEARTRYNVAVYERNLPFDYEGYYRDSHARSETPPH